MGSCRGMSSALWLRPAVHCAGVGGLVAATVGGAGALTGCGTVVHGTSQTVTVETTPPGATVTVLSTRLPGTTSDSFASTPLGGERYTTPATMQLSRRMDTVLSIAKPGYQTQTVTLQSTIDGSVAETLVKGGILGGVVDMGTGAAFRLVPDRLALTLTPLPTIDAPTRVALAGAPLGGPAGTASGTPSGSAAGWSSPVRTPPGPTQPIAAPTPVTRLTPVATPGAIASSTLPAAQRLRALDQLRADKLISEAEYTRYRSMILGRVTGESMEWEGGDEVAAAEDADESEDK